MRHETETDAGFETTTQTGRGATVESNLAVPLGQALGVGIAVGVVAGIATLLLGGPIAGLQGGELWAWGGRVAGALGGLVWAGATVWLVVDHRALLWRVERAASLDRDRDGYEGQQQTTTTVQVADPTGRRSRFAALPLSEDRLTEVAREVLGTGADFSRHGLSGVLSQNEYEQLSAAMLKGGLLVELPDRSRQLSASGRALFRKLA